MLLPAATPAYFAATPRCVADYAAFRCVRFSPATSLSPDAALAAISDVVCHYRAACCHATRVAGAAHAAR